jgi:hypothetical protein
VEAKRSREDDLVDMAGHQFFECLPKRVLAEAGAAAHHPHQVGAQSPDAPEERWLRRDATTATVYPCCEDLILTAMPAFARIPAAAPGVGVLGYLLDRVIRKLTHPRPGWGFAGEQYAQLFLVELLRMTLDGWGTCRSARFACCWSRFCGRRSR